MVKIRTGFVSNSSSSSFLVFFPRKPNNVIQLRDMLFSRYDIDHDFRFKTGFDDDLSMSLMDVAEIVFDDMENQKPNSAKVKKDWIKNKTWDLDKKVLGAAVHWKRLQTEEDGSVSAKELGRLERESEKEAEYDMKHTIEYYRKETIKEEGHCFIYEFEYADDDGTWQDGILRHGNIFRNLRHIKDYNQ